MHGGPGVGKSHVLKLLRELFEEVLGWNMGLEYQMAALQAVMADLLGLAMPKLARCNRRRIFFSSCFVPSLVPDRSPQ